MGGCGNGQNLESDPSFEGPASAPKDQAEDGKDEEEAKQSNEDLASPGQTLIRIEAVEIPFFFDDLALGPALVVAALAAGLGGGGGGGGSEGAGEATGRGGPGVTAVGRVGRALHGAVEGRGGLHGRRLVAIVGVPGRALHVVSGSFWGSGRRRRQARHVRVRFGMHPMHWKSYEIFLLKEKAEFDPSETPAKRRRLWISVTESLARQKHPEIFSGSERERELYGALNQPKAEHFLFQFHAEERESRVWVESFGASKLQSAQAW